MSYCCVKISERPWAIYHLFSEKRLRRTNNSPILFPVNFVNFIYHYSDFIMSAMASQITGVSIVDSTVCSRVDKKVHRLLITCQLYNYSSIS